MIDAHTHLSDKKFSSPDEIVAEFIEVGGRVMVDAGFDAESSENAFRNSQKYDCVYFTCGFHPSEEGKDNDFGLFDRLAGSDRCVAVGEIGLDHHYKPFDASGQRELFLRQLAIADERGLPVVIHSRDCSGEMAEFLSANSRLLKHGFLMHCYSESAEQARLYADLGGYFSFGGVTTFKNAKKDDVLRAVPIDRLLVETDAPYLAPEPVRGSVNRPAFLRYVYEKIARVREVDIDSLKKTVEQNFLRLFKKVSL